MTPRRTTPRRRFRGLIRSEAIKAVTTPVTYGFLAAILVLVALNTSLTLTDQEAQFDTGAGVRHVFTASRDFLALFIALGAVGAAGEFRHGTAIPTFLATPVRSRVLAAKVTAHLGLGAIVAFACVLAQMAIALPWIAGHGGSGSPWDPDVLQPALGSVLSGAAYCALGVGVGLLVRNQVVALVITFGWFAVAENALANFVPDVSHFLPGGLFSGADQPGADLLPLPLAAAILAIYVAALGVLALRTTLRGDIA
jgi:ABC-2 type transport system permease protein